MTYELIPLLPLGLVPDPRHSSDIGSRTRPISSPCPRSSCPCSGFRSLLFFDVAGGHHSTIRLYTWLTSGMLDIHIGFSIDRLTVGHAAARHHRQCARPHLYHRLHAGRAGLCPLLQLHRPVHVLHADAGAGRQFSAAVRLLGSRRPLFLSLDRPLVRTPVGLSPPPRRPSS